MISRVVDVEEIPLLIVHDSAETTRVQFDLRAWIQYPTSGVLRRITWTEVAEADPLAVLRTIESDAGLGAPIESRDSPQSLVYRTIACTLALGLDSTTTWQVVHAWVDVVDPDETDGELFDAFSTGRVPADGKIDASLDRVETSGELAFHQPVWVLLRGMQPVALLNVNGSVHTATGEIERAPSCRGAVKHTPPRTPGRPPSTSTAAGRLTRLALGLPPAG